MNFLYVHMSSIDPVTAKKLAERMKRLYGKVINIKEDFFGKTPPSALVSSYGYPKVALGVLLSDSDKTLEEDSSVWVNMSLQEIISNRLSLINARRLFSVSVPRYNNRIYENILEATLSIKSVDVEANLSKFRLSREFSKNLPFYGISGVLKKFRVVDNAKIPNYIDSIINDNIKAEEGILELYSKGLSDYYISRLLSLGVLGTKTNRKLVPSRWSITATHELISRYLEKHLKDRPSIGNYYVFHTYIHGNEFYVLLLPGNLRSELLEALMPGSAYNLRYENPIIGIDDESGGKYAARLSILEYLKSMRRKADGIVFRVVTKDYQLPLGVWVVREGVRRAFYGDLQKFSEINEALRYINSRLIRKYNISVWKMIKYSRILRQSKITKFFQILPR